MVDKEKLKDATWYIPNLFKILTKDQRLVPMELWPSQRYYIEHKTNRNVCLKSRQTGFSTGVMADNAHALFTEPYHRQTLITHDQETSEFLFQTVDRFYRNLTWNKGKSLKEMEPTRDWRSGSRMRFPIIDSYVYIDSARSDSLGIGHTLSRAHLSEIAKWHPLRAATLFADISQTVPEKGILTAESTPKGRGGKFFDLYQGAKLKEIPYTPFFFPWWWDITCKRACESLELVGDELLLRKHYDLTDEQIAFRREKLAELGDLFFQEYPENDVDCWLSSDISVFDGVAIRSYLSEVYEGRHEGNLTIWKDVIGGDRYVIGVDMAAGKAKGDFSSASVLSVKRNDYVARLRGRFPPDLFTEELIRLGRRYNDAEIAVERDGHGQMALRILIENNYPNIYYFEDDMTLSDKVPTEPGWKTSIRTKPIMVSDMKAAIRAMDIGIWSENLLNEAAGYIYDQASESKYKSMPGGHDDELDSLMIALQVRSQAPLVEAEQSQITQYAKI